MAVLNVFKKCKFCIFVKRTHFLKSIFEESQDQIYQTDCLLLREFIQ